MRLFFSRPQHMTTKFVRLDTGVCQACWQCIDTCHKNVIGKIDFLGHRHARIARPEQCAGCLKCVKECKQGAFTMIHQFSGNNTMDTIIEKKPFNRRAFYSVALFVSGLILPFSGIMNHQLQFDPLTTERHFWMSVHNMSALLFTLSVIAHLSMNWRALVNYLRHTRTVVISKEALLAVIVIIGIVGIFASHVFHVR